MTYKTRPAFTLVELLVVIAIIGILIALLLPAVQAAREAARRAQCINNLTQLIIAVNNYEMAHAVYPSGTIAKSGPIRSVASGYHHGWINQILPYIEQKNAYRHIDRTVGVYHKNNAPVRKIGVATLLCPTSSGGLAGYSDYAGVHHDVEAPIDVDNNGMFFLNSRVGYDDVMDGASQTFFIGEKLTLTGDLGWMSGTRATLRNTGTPVNAILALRQGGPFSSGLNSPSYPPGDRRDAGNGSMMEMMGEEGYEVEPVSESFEADEAPEADEPAGTDEVPAEESPLAAIVDGGPTGPTAVGGFSSYHPDGANFVFGDGSVRYITETIDTKVYQQLGHRADGKLLDQF